MRVGAMVSIMINLSVRLGVQFTILTDLVLTPIRFVRIKTITSMPLIPLKINLKGLAIGDGAMDVLTSEILTKESY